MRIFGFNITRDPIVVDSDKVVQLTNLLDEARKEKELESKLREKESKKLKANLEIAQKKQKIRKEQEKISRARTALEHLLAAQRLNESLESAPKDEIRDAEYNLAILKRVVQAKNLGFPVENKNITGAIDSIQALINGH